MACWRVCVVAVAAVLGVSTSASTVASAAVDLARWRHVGSGNVFGKLFGQFEQAPADAPAFVDRCSSYLGKMLPLLKEGYTGTQVPYVLDHECDVYRSIEDFKEKDMTHQKAGWQCKHYARTLGEEFQGKHEYKAWCDQVFLYLKDKGKSVKQKKEERKKLQNDVHAIKKKLGSLKHSLRSHLTAKRANVTGNAEEELEVNETALYLNISTSNELYMEAQMESMRKELNNNMGQKAEDEDMQDFGQQLDNMEDYFDVKKGTQEENKESEDSDDDELGCCPSTCNPCQANVTTSNSTGADEEADADDDDAEDEEDEKLLQLSFLQWSPKEAVQRMNLRRKQRQRFLHRSVQQDASVDGDVAMDDSDSEQIRAPPSPLWLARHAGGERRAVPSKYLEQEFQETDEEPAEQDEMAGSGTAMEDDDESSARRSVWKATSNLHARGALGHRVTVPTGIRRWTPVPESHSSHLPPWAFWKLNLHAATAAAMEEMRKPSPVEPAQSEPAVSEDPDSWDAQNRDQDQVVVDESNDAIESSSETSETEPPAAEPAEQDKQATEDDQDNGSLPQGFFNKAPEEQAEAEHEEAAAPAEPEAEPRSEPESAENPAQPEAGVAEPTATHTATQTSDAPLDAVDAKSAADAAAMDASDADLQRAENEAAMLEPLMDSRPSPEEPVEADRADKPVEEDNSSAAIAAVSSPAQNLAAKEMQEQEEVAQLRKKLLRGAAATVTATAAAATTPPIASKEEATPPVVVQHSAVAGAPAQLAAEAAAPWTKAGRKRASKEQVVEAEHVIMHKKKPKLKQRLDVWHMLVGEFSKVPNKDDFMPRCAKNIGGMLPKLAHDYTRAQVPTVLVHSCGVYSTKESFKAENATIENAQWHCKRYAAMLADEYAGKKDYPAWCGKVFTMMSQEIDLQKELAERAVLQEKLNDLKDKLKTGGKGSVKKTCCTQACRICKSSSGSPSFEDSLKKAGKKGSPPAPAVSKEPPVIMGGEPDASLGRRATPNWTPRSLDDTM